MTKRLLLIPALLALFCSCGEENKIPDDGGKPDPPVVVPPEIIKPDVPEFSRGADISWVTQMEQAGSRFFNKNGQEMDCFELMKELGLDAIRLRVWYGDKGWCTTEDVVYKARRAAELGMNVLIDFHYSDTWADPGQQNKPSAWKGLNLPTLKSRFQKHTSDVLNALKEAGVEPAWVQIGNEIGSGMLWDTNAYLSCASADNGEYKANWANLGSFISLGYETVKSIFPDCTVIVHLEGGDNAEMYNWFFDNLEENGGRWDMIGLTLYPYYGRDYATPREMISRCIDNMNALREKYGCEVMIVETGMECADSNGNLLPDSKLKEGKDNLSHLISECLLKTECRGVFYWEPQSAPYMYNLGAFDSNGYPTVIMDAFAH